MQGSGDPRFGYPRAPQAAPQPYAAPTGRPASYPPVAPHAQPQHPGYAAQPSPSYAPAPHSQAPQTYGQPQAPYVHPQQAMINQQMAQQQMMQQQQMQQQQQQQSASPWGNLGGGLAAHAGGLSVPSIPGMGGMTNALKGAPTGLPPAVAFGLAIAAVVVALVFDVIFLKVHIPGIGGYAWYLTTALSFAGAGFGAMKFTRATRTVALTAIGVAGVLYGFADLGLSMVLEDVTIGGAFFLGVQGLVIALVTGGGGIHRGARARAAEQGE